ncbi:beta-1,4-mannooligosaccharide/beta-1,4-mannosyl-N-acetylglucosamine phosphorylase [Orenia metallireducens]|jgi:beta-1,4-mannooligosaccharide/beta-1,4-mannosyl-N-acetylglucosamine phosphorylase|uniref:Beta-1,4-mannooligosaccharide/beta-1,4-mannosyl-N-acetylglucosamine phosphorylase n=1 Tax=Orenia metallireducens TaxID=1413210 RepID=A0A285FZG1_9FIRM|nr:glycoside hydrolase family 130 protein [Orenia metallireducens]PRX35631.1 beta-1,4-mannooligosaccharide/beta-1,4-mannosyl-N-acetylglucosamine phosphorylase [Orenia metallireducens]SNY15611.1 beta-1,4-mannooligosaccharide/beta-1,4-mannosyl-N-acetylglucosamine phosphorylase [Orenia metallireducens]
MSKVKIIGESLANMPWEEKPEGYEQVVWRHLANPITDWNPTPSAARVYNSAVVPFEGEFVGVFRMDHKNGRAHLHFGRSKDALNWEFEDETINWVDADGNEAEPGYAYDPRVVKIEDTYYILWCSEFHGPTIGVGMTKDFKTFTRLEDAFVPFNRNGVLFSRKINDHFVMLNRPSDTGHTPFGDIFLSQSKDMTYWGKHRHVMSNGGSGWWQGTKIGGGPAPIETTEGWLMFYHGVSGTCNGYVYSMGAAILDIDDPSKVLYRTRDYLLTPEKEYETTGFVPNVAFPCATLHDADTGRIAIYYGAADTYTAVAYCEVNELVEYIKANSEV